MTEIFAFTCMQCISALSIFVCTDILFSFHEYTVELQWPECLPNHEKMFETGEIRANKC